MLYPDSRIIIFCKAPEPGKVKTRLATTIGNEAATTVHEFLAHHCLEGLFKENIAPIELWCAPDTTHEFFQYCASAYSVSLQRQWGNDLGERMENAFAQVLSNNKSAVIIGTDCPSISPAYLKSAFDCLEKSNAVIGPAEDGGYVLLGLRQLTSCIFHNMPWGQDQVLEKTIERLGREVIKLNTLWDIDYAKDVERLRETGTQIELAEDFKAHLSVLKLS